MSKYTTSLRNCIFLYGENEVLSWFSSYDLKDYLFPEQIETIEKAGFWSKEKLAKKIINHFIMREIGYETTGLFRLKVINHMEEIMEYYLPLIYTTCLEYDPLINVDYTETYEMIGKDTANSEISGNNNSQSNSNSESENLVNNTPQGKNKIEDTKNGTYVSNININKSLINDTTSQNTLSQSNGETNRNENYTRHFKGNQGISATYQAMIKQFRENIKKITSEIIDELEKDFMGLW